MDDIQSVLIDYVEGIRELTNWLVVIQDPSKYLKVYTLLQNKLDEMNRLLGKSDDNDVTEEAMITLEVFENPQGITWESILRRGVSND